MARTLRNALTCATLGLAAIGCDEGSPSGANSAIDAPSFSPAGKHDNAEQAIRYIQGVGTQAQVQGRFQTELKWRGFTFEAQAGQKVHMALSAQLERNGLLIEQAVDTQMLLYGPADSPDALFEQVIADSGMAQQAQIDVELEKDGYYLLAATRDEAVQQAQFELEIECDNCGAQDGTDPDLLCTDGKLFIEGAKLRTQTWDRCQVIVLEPTRLPEGEKLTIGPDVHVRAHYYITDFHPEGWGEVNIEIEGELDMQSTPDHLIHFESNVEGKQWDGIRLRRPGTQMHDFVFQDTHNGMIIGQTAEGTRIENAEFRLNRQALYLNAAGIELEKLEMHDNQTAIYNSQRGGGLDSLFLLDSELYLNEVPVRLTGLEGSFIDGLYVHDNDNGINIANAGGESSEPENWVNISNSRFHTNGYGVNLRGNGVVDHCEFYQNRTYGVRTDNGWQKVKNSIFEGNSTECVNPEGLRDYSQQWFANCSAATTTAIAHTVLRNNLIEKNDGYGVGMLGDPTTGRNGRGVGRDPAILNSEIRANGRAAVAVVDAPIYSIEFNVIKDNTEGAIHLAYSANAQIVQLGLNRTTNRREVTGVGVRQNRIQRNNFETDETVFHRLVYRAANSDDVEPLAFELPANWNGFVRELTLSNNYVPAADVAALEALDAMSMFTVMPLLDAPEETAGIIVDIEPFDD